MARFSKKWIEVFLGTTFACLGFSFIEGFYKAAQCTTSVSPAQQENPKQGSSLEENLVSPLNEIRAQLQSFLEEGHHYLGFSLSQEVKRSVLLKLYNKVGFQPLWFTKDRKFACGEKVKEILSHVDEEGLDLEAYRPLLTQLESWIGQKGEKLESASLEDLLKADILLSRILLQYISDVRGERLSPKKIDKELYLDVPKIDEAEVFFESLEGSDQSTGEWLAKIPPQAPQYKGLKGVLKTLREKKSLGKGEKMLSPGPSLKKGSSGKRVMELREALSSRGYPTESNSEIFGEDLEEAVKKFQEGQGVSSDGVVGLTTQTLLSKSIEDQINQVIVTLERWRWMPKDLGNKYVFVNIPEFEVRAYEKGNLIFTMPVIVGRTYRETPVFSSKIVNVILNPSWNVPNLIASQDELKDVQKKGAQYFLDKKIHVYKNGAEVDPRHVNWSHVSKEHFDFHLRQDPGEENALGRIRFTIISPFDVYLHGTPKQELFEKTKRTLSSGCIRLEDPLKMAEFVFGQQGKWSDTMLKAAIDTKRTQTIPLENPVQVYIQYFTVVLDDAGGAKFLEDVYGQDKEILKALNVRKAQAP